MPRTKTSGFVLTLRLHYEPWQLDYLDKMFRAGGYLYNSLTADRRKALIQMERTRKWQFIQKDIAALLKKTGSAEPTGEQERQLEELYTKRKKILADYQMSEYDFQYRIKKWRERSSKLADSSVAQKIASRVWENLTAIFLEMVSRLRLFRGKNSVLWKEKQMVQISALGMEK